MEINSSTNSSSAKKRPSFLTTLCVLSFAMTFIGLLFFIYITYCVFKDDDYEPFSIGQKLVAVICCLSEIISLAGVILMMQLKKTGFLIYTISELLSSVLLIFSAASALSQNDSGRFYEAENFAMGIVIAFFILALICDVIFVILYATTRKYMK